MLRLCAPTVSIFDDLEIVLGVQNGPPILVWGYKCLSKLGTSILEAKFENKLFAGGQNDGMCGPGGGRRRRSRTDLGKDLARLWERRPGPART